MKKLALTALLVSLCASQISGCSIYRLGSRQGNEVTAEKLAELEQALTREQVVEIMGSPLLVDPFRDNRWDYVYYYKKHQQAAELRRITVFFKGELVNKIEHSNVEEKIAEPEANGEASNPSQELDSAPDGPEETTGEHN